MVEPSEKRPVVTYLRHTYSFSVKRSCKLAGLHRSMWYYQAKRADDTDLIEKLNELADKLPTRGLDEYYYRLRSEGYRWNRKRVYRVYKMLKLQHRRKRKRRLPATNPQPLQVPEGLNIQWSMDFMHDRLRNGRRIRVLNVIDNYNREALWVDPRMSYSAESVINALEVLEIDRGLPTSIRVDNGPEFRSKKLMEYCDQKQVKLDFIKPGKPMQNGFVERFNRSFREDVLDAYLFETLSQMRSISNNWKDDYNDNHHHKSLDRLTPNQRKDLYRKESANYELSKAKMNDSLRESALHNSTQALADR